NRSTCRAREGSRGRTCRKTIGPGILVVRRAASRSYRSRCRRLRMNERDRLARFRGEFPKASASARRIAAALEAPGCHRRTVLEASGANLDKLGALVADSESDRQ